MARKTSTGSNGGRVNGDRPERGMRMTNSSHGVNQFAEPQAWLAAIVESAEDAIVGKTLDGEVVSWNPAAEGLFGYRAEEIVGQPIAILADPAHPSEMADILSRLRDGERIGRYETTRRRKDGTIVPVSLTISPVRSDAGTLIGASKIARDITDRRRSEEQIRLLNADLSHRTKNLLTMVSALVERTQRDTVPEFREVIRGRIMALDRANSLLSAGGWQQADLDLVIRRVLETFGTRSHGFLVEGPAVAVSAEAAQTLAIAIHELATNAVKYGALAREGGVVEVSWETGGGDIALHWREVGGPSAALPTCEGLGLTIVRLGIERQLDGVLGMDWQETGLACRIALPARHLR